MRLFLFLIYFYQKGISPYIGFRCRFVPSCSTYMAEAVQQFGLLKGISLGLKRLLRCHPWGGHGFDPVKKHG